MQIVPTDLNSYLYDMERNIADFAIVLGDAKNATRFSALAAQRREAIQALMWDGSTGAGARPCLLASSHASTACQGIETCKKARCRAWESCC
jgi:Trehalase